jgi:hypothetical protein
MTDSLHQQLTLSIALLEMARGLRPIDNRRIDDVRLRLRHLLDEMPTTSPLSDSATLAQ